jgi:hypothetical protein
MIILYRHTCCFVAWVGERRSMQIHIEDRRRVRIGHWVVILKLLMCDIPMFLDRTTIIVKYLSTFM